jgi:hypothetical protein
MCKACLVHQNLVEKRIWLRDALMKELFELRKEKENLEIQSSKKIKLLEERLKE